jgi:hypothetical protein
MCSTESYYYLTGQAVNLRFSATYRAIRCRLAEPEPPDRQLKPLGPIFF